AQHPGGGSSAGVVGRPVEGGAVTIGEPRRMSAEQSNTSIVFGEELILKVFRRIETGVNPDVEVTRALTERGFTGVPRQHGALELVGAGGMGTALTVLSDFVAGGREGWALAVDDVARADPQRSTVLPAVETLGAAIAAMHDTLAAAFGAVPATDGAGSWVTDMRAQAERVLDTASRVASAVAAPVLERQEELRARLHDLGPAAASGMAIRIHGDLHLGQVLADAQGRWQLLDFEGEPSRSLAERRRPNPPLRDVAGMLRSFDYAAATGNIGGPLTPESVAWRDEARRRFLDGYLGALVRQDLLPEDVEVWNQLAAFELDKAVYELGYELANRPAWVPIPIGGIQRVLNRPTSGRSPDMAKSRTSRVSQSPDWRAAQADVDAIVAGTHREPHRVLGLHTVDGKGVVRAWRPDAEGVEVVVDGSDPVAAERRVDAGFFEVALPEPPTAGAYRLRVTYADGTAYDLQDPYGFWPTLGDVDLHLAGEGRHEELWRRMGAHTTTVDGVEGTAFAVWAPAAQGVRVIGDFNSWDGRLHPMRLLGSSGTWELFLPEVGSGAYYKYEIVTAEGHLVTRADPYAFATDVPPGTASRVHQSSYRWEDNEWLATRRERRASDAPVSIYEVHLGSWRHGDDGRPMTYREIAGPLADHVTELGFTHIELLPVAEHPFGGSWGYQVTGYFAPTARFGDPDDFRFMVDHLHQRGIGVIVDWVPAHFPKDEWALARFDGTALYEHADPRQGEHPDWGTLVFNFGRNEVRNFLIANALFWIEDLHIDGLRVDAVASMLYLDYSREEDQWVPNAFGGRENLEAVSFLAELNKTVYGRNPDALMVAEESTAWPGVSRPVHLGGLGFGFKWNMGWMHDTLDYFSRDSIHRRYHHHQLTFGLLYAWSENYILPLSHDEVVHGKRSLLDKMPGDRWQKFANLRALYGYMWAHPGKQLLFMGGEFGQWREWAEERQLDWYLLGEQDHAGLQRLVGDLNAVYREQPALWQRDTEPSGFTWIDANNTDDNLLSFVRWGREGVPPLVCVGNFAPVPRHGLRLGLPVAGEYAEVLNTDGERYAGSNVGNLGGVVAEDVAWHGLPASAEITVPPLATLWLRPV
ncbi:MAG: 1,4-alpha-glucan branching protein GlgB, partial [Egibacteraceae bacterium]